MPEDGKDESLQAALARVEKLRDRFALLSSAFAAACILVALWVRAPALDVELPLAGEGKAAFNIGFVLAIGIPVITIVYAWICGTLVSMRHCQIEIIESLPLTAPRRNLVLGQLRNSLAPPLGSNLLDRIAVWITCIVRVLISFLIPAIACLWIAVMYFSELQIYPEHNLTDCAPTHASNRSLTAAECRRHVRFWEHFLGLTLSQHLTGSPGAHKDDRYAIPYGHFEEVCSEIWKRREEWRKSANQPGQQKADSGPATGEKCAFDEFPQFVLPLTSWVNLGGLLVTLFLGIFGLHAHLTLPLPRGLRT